MSGPVDPRGGAPLSRLLYCLLLLAYPPAFRSDHGEDAADVFVDLVRATRRRGVAALIGLWLRSVPDVVRGGFQERRGSHRRSAVPPARGSANIDALAGELRHAVRALMRRPAFTVTAVLTLAIGIGATTAVVSVVDAVLLRPLPYARSDELVTLGHVAPEIASGEWGLSRAGYFYFREHAASLQDIAAYRATSLVILGDGPPERIEAVQVTASLLATLGVSTERGRPFSVDDDTPGAAPVVILSHSIWVRSFGADPDIIGAPVSLSGTRYEVIGVMPRGVHFPSPSTHAWVPLGFDPAATPVNQHIYGGVARLRAGVGPDEALTELDGLVSRFAEEMPSAYGGGFMERSGFRVFMRSLLEDTVGNLRALLGIVLAAAVLVLIIACANVANLTLLRSAGRRREVAVRTALGASRAALLRYSLSEASVVAITGGAMGVALAWAGVRLLVLSAPVGLSRVDEIALRPLAALYAFATVAVVTGILAAVSTPGHVGLAGQLKGGGRAASADRHRMRVRGAFVVTQVSMAVLLMAGSGLLLRSFVKLRAVDPGFSADNVLTLRLSLAPTKYPDDAAAFRLFEQASERLRGLPGVIAVGAVDGLPLVSHASDNLNGFADLPDGSEQNVLTDTKFAGPGYLEVLGMRLLEGRMFEQSDMQPATGGDVVTRSLAQQLWPGESALGKRARPLMTDYPWHTVVGVVDDVRTEDITRAPAPTIYFPYTDWAWGRSFFFAIRTEGEPESLVPAVRREIWALDPDVPLASAATMSDLVAGHLSRTSFTLTLVGVGAAIAVFLCSIGIYGVIAYSVSQRHFEIGVRMALGARGPQVAGMVLGQTMTLAAVGIAIGLMLSLVGMGLMESLLFEVTATDPLTLAAVAIGLALVAVMAGTLPARRATRVDAVVALQGD